MQKDINKEKKSQAQDGPVDDNFLSEWSNIDATSIYRVGSAPENPMDKTELKQIVKETNSFFKIGIVMFVLVFLIIFILRYI